MIQDFINNIRVEGLEIPKKEATEQTPPEQDNLEQRLVEIKSVFLHTPFPQPTDAEAVTALVSQVEGDILLGLSLEIVDVLPFELVLEKMPETVAADIENTTEALAYFATINNEHYNSGPRLGAWFGLTDVLRDTPYEDDVLHLTLGSMPTELYDDALEALKNSVEKSKSHD